MSIGLVLTAMLGFLALALSVFFDSVAASGVNASSLGGSQVAAAWYAGYHAESFPLSEVSWSKYTHLIYAFATTTPDVNVLALGPADEQLLPQFVSTAHQNGVKALLSIGGWGGSRWYSSNVGSAQNRTAFVGTVTTLVSKYSLDGLDFDWEYPAKQGTGCNTISSNDTSNFLSFLQELRASPSGANLTLCAATSLTPWNDTSGNPSKDVSAFSQVLDWITIMNYDVWTYVSTVQAVDAGVGKLVGPTSPLNDTCAGAKPGVRSAVSAVDAWTQAKFPANQIVLGVPSYGHAFIVPTSAAYQSNQSSDGLASYPTFIPQSPSKHIGDIWDNASSGGPDSCGVEQPLSPSGVYNMFGLVDAGFLNADGSVHDGMGYRYDECSQTPYVYNASSQIMVAYDNVQSFASKGGFIGSMSLKGFAMWEAGGDYNDLLLDSILSATVNTSSSNTQGKKSVPSPGNGPGNHATALRAKWVLSAWTFVLGYGLRMLY